MKKRLFTYAVIVHIKKEMDTKTVEEFDSKMVIEPTTILAKNDKDVLFKVTRLIPEEYTTDPENVEIIVRPF